MKDQVESLLKLSKPEEQAELKMLYNATITNANSYQNDPTAANMKDWRTSKDELKNIVERLHDKYAGNTDTSEMHESFVDVQSILPYLQGRGYKVSRATLYNHLKEGKYSKDPKTGQFLVKKIDKYAKNHLILEETGKKEGDENVNLQARKLKAETREREAKASRAEYELNIIKGKYIDKEDMIRELVGRALILDSSLRYTLKNAAPDIIELCSGDQKKVAVIRDELMIIIDTIMNSFASTDDFVINLKIEGANNE